MENDHDDGCFISIFNVPDQFESAIIHAATVNDHYDEVEQQLKQMKREKIESEQSVKQACLRMMEQSEEAQQLEREEQLTDLLQSTTVSKRDQVEQSEYR